MPAFVILILEIYKQFLDDLNSGKFYDRINKIVEVQEKTMQKLFLEIKDLKVSYKTVNGGEAHVTR